MPYVRSSSRSPSSVRDEMSPLRSRVRRRSRCPVLLLLASSTTLKVYTSPGIPRQENEWFQGQYFAKFAKLCSGRRQKLALGFPDCTFSGLLTLLEPLTIIGGHRTSVCRSSQRVNRG